MLRLLHLISAVALVVAHTAFLIRGLYIERGAIKPVPLDRLARSLAQALLPATALTGLLRMVPAGAPFFPHGFAGILPVAAIPTVFALRLAFKRRPRLPWLLPALNLALIIGAMATGFVYRY